MIFLSRTQTRMENPMARRNKQNTKTNQNKNPKPNEHTHQEKKVILKMQMYSYVKLVKYYFLSLNSKTLGMFASPLL